MALNSTSIQLKWTEPRDNNAPITEYIIHYQQLSIQQFQKAVNQTFPPNLQIRNITQLSPGVTYGFTVKGVNAIGVGNPSTEINVTTLDDGGLL